MYYQVNLSSEPEKTVLFPKLSLAKEFVLKYSPNSHAVIRHRRDGKTIKITSYYPKFGFETETIKEIQFDYAKHFLNDQP